MKYGIWMIAMIALAARSGFAATANNAEQMTPMWNEIVQTTQTKPLADQPVSVESQAELKAKEFVDRLTDLRYQKSDLDRQTSLLNQAISDLRGQLEQNKFDLEQVKVDQKDVQRNLKALEREKKMFDKQDNQRKELGK